MSTTWQIVDDERRFLEIPTADRIRLKYLLDLRDWSDAMLWQLEGWQLERVESVPNDARMLILEFYNRVGAEFDIPSPIESPSEWLECVFLAQESLFGLLLWVKRGLTNAEVEAIFDELDESIVILEESS